MSFSSDQEPNEKAIRLVDYLLRLASLRTKLVRDIAEYDRTLWISDVPHEKGCFTQAWGRDEEYDSDVWVEVQNQPEPELPSVPDPCKDWVDRSSLRDKDDLPELLSEMTRQVANPGWREGSDQPEFILRTERLEDHPEVQRAWDRYVEERWLSWVEEHNVWESVHKVYSSLFAIHQEQLRLGEEYELVLGLGLLTWQTPTNQRIRRHLIVADASLEFEARLGKFTVRPNSDGAKVRPELDMLDIEEQPVGGEETAKSSLTNTGDDPWDKDCIEGILKALVHSINSLGEYDDTLEAIKGVRTTGKPIVECAPAIILRKRSTKGLTETLKRIRERIEKGGDLPTEFGDLAEVPPRSDADSGATPDGRNEEFDGEVFFPKPWNEEQRRIVDKIRSASGVLVQGPPGTGKSHTIANLICHLLATGRRILVTAKTPRALQVLMGRFDRDEKQQDRKDDGLIPKEIRPLCISLLGSGLEEKRSLESSVGGILRKREEWNEQRATVELKELEQKLRRLREEKAKVDRRLRDIRESETHSQTIAEGTYRGTAVRIAQTVNRDQSDFEWFTDTVPFDQDCRISESHFRSAVDDLRRFTPEKRRELNLACPEDVLSQERFAKLVELETRAIEEEARSASGADEQTANHISTIDDTMIQGSIDSLTAFQDERRRLLVAPHSWMQEAVRDVIGGNPSLWRELYRVTRNAIASIETRVSVADDNSVDIPEKANIRSLLEDVCTLKEHMDNGGKLGWWVFRPKLVKEHIHVLGTRVNGRPPAKLEQMRILADVLHVRVEFEKAWGFWAGRCEKSQGPFALQLQVLKSACESLDAALSLETLIERCRNVLKKCPALTEPMWADESQIETLIASCRFALARNNKHRATLGIHDVETPIVRNHAEEDSHPVASELLEAIRNRDVDGFARAQIKLQDLEKERQCVQKLDENLNVLRYLAPSLTEALERTCHDSYWDSRVQRIRDAWHWAQARTWVEEYIRKEDAPSLAERARQIEDEINDTIAKLASLHAWSFCFSRLREDHRRHMKAWQKNVGMITKSGTGKQDSFHRKEAQKNLNNCREAIPAWVMPLHRVWDTVDPAPGLFDVIIVDEASQCGFEALPLFYIAKTILIVGDDKQISPEAEGIKLEPVTQLINQFLYDFEHKASFNINRSLFDQGELRYSSNHIVLREHFRCMPEIIRFSNELCYSDTPLIPLRQYGPDRLAPLEHVFVNGGYREGSGSAVVNRPEADAVVEKIVHLCSDERYSNKTMGVVVLQGQAQAGLIEGKLLELLGAEEMERRRLVCGHPYTFQGDERDIMFLSMVVAPNERIGPLTKVADERRFNVAASRARDQMYLFHSVTRDDLSMSCLRRKLLEFFEDTTPEKIGGLDRDELERRAAQDNRAVVRPPQPFDSWFEVDVALELCRKGFRVLPQYEVAGKRIDLVVEGGHARLAVECDGDEWHGPDRYEADMQRQRILERCGWVFFRVRGAAFYSNKESALQGLWGALHDRGIIPGSPDLVARPEVDLKEEGAEGIDSKPGGIDESAAAPPTPMPQGISENTGTNGSTQHDAQSDENDDPVEGEPSTSRAWSLKGEPTPQPKLWERDRERDQSADLPEGSRSETVSGPNGNPDDPGKEDTNRTGNGYVIFPDPRTGKPREVEAGLKQIVSEHGPLPCHFAYRLYIRRAGFRKVSRRVEEVLSLCMKSAAAHGEIELTDEYGNGEPRDKIARETGTSHVRLRPRGDRNIEDIPPSELAEAMRTLEAKGVILGQDEEEVFRKTLDYFDLKRLTEKTRNILMAALAIYTQNDDAESP